MSGAITIYCKNCDEPCGTYYEAKRSGPPEDCYPAEYGEEPEVIDADGNEFCSEFCCAVYNEVFDGDDD